MGEPIRKPSMEDLSILKLDAADEMLTAEISDGRIVSIPIAWFPRLRGASLKQLQNFEISPSGYGIHWPDLDEDISVRAFVGVGS
jgi:hypothetical protein